MITTPGKPAAVVDILTVLSLGVIAAAVNVGLHEAIHAVACTLAEPDVRYPAELEELMLRRLGKMIDGW